MKIIAALILMMGIASAEQSRTVNGKKVDLEPLTDWLAKPDGDRPLSHWKIIRVFEVGHDYGLGKVSTVEIDGGNQKSIILANIPPAMLKFLDSMKAQHGALAAMRIQVENERLEAKRLHDIWWNGGRVEYGVVVAHNSRTGWDEDSEDARHLKMNQAITRLENDRDTLSKLEDQYSEHIKKAKGVATELAMFTGKKYAGYDVWDCGRR